MFRRSVAVEPTKILDIIKDDLSDNMYLECAMESDAQYIVTYNYTHFNPVKGQIFNKNGEKVIICDGQEFLDILDEIKRNKAVGE